MIDSRNIHFKDVITKASASLIVKAVGTTVGTLLSIIIARNIGAEGVGVLGIANRIVNILIVFGTAGVLQLLIKSFATDSEIHSGGTSMSTLYSAYFVCGTLTFILALIFSFFSSYLSQEIFAEDELKLPLIFFMIALLPQVISRIFSAVLIGNFKIWQSQLVGNTLSVIIILPVIFIMDCLSYTIDLYLVSAVYAMARISVTIIVGIRWRRFFFTAKYKTIGVVNLLVSSSPFFIIKLVQVLQSNLDIIILGLVCPVREVGLYAIASRLASLVNLLLQVVNTAVAPKIASLYSKNKLFDLESMIISTSRTLFVFAFIVFILYISFGRLILSLWGDEYLLAYSMLIILAVGNLIDVSFGSVGYLLSMTGNEKTLLFINILLLLLNILLSVVLSLLYGSVGMAISSAITLLFSNVIKYRKVMSEIGVGVFTSRLEI